MAALAAEAALDAPRASMMAAPRFLNCGNELVVEPCHVHLIEGRRTGHRGVMKVRVHGRRVVAPHCEPLDLRDRRAGLRRQLCQRPVVVETHHGCEVARIEVGRVALGDQAVGIGRIADHENLDAARGMVVQGLALHREDRRVGFHQFAAFHARSARPRPDEERIVRTLEGGIRIVGGNDVLHQRERAVVDLHDHAVQGTHRGRNLQELKDHGLVRSQHLPRKRPGTRGRSRVGRRRR